MVKTEYVNVQKPKLDYIDSLRGIAIIMVVMVHTAQSFNNLHPYLNIFAGYGQMGVQLFFIVSSFTLCLSMFRRRSDDPNLFKFYMRRYFRIAPLYYCGILLYFFQSTLYNFIETGVFAPNPKYSIVNVLSNVLFLHGFYPPANNIIVPGGWSIGTEMVFYIIFPAVFLLYKRFQKNIFLINLIPILGFAISSLIVYAICYAFNYELKKNDFIYYNLVSQVPVFLLGMTLFFNLERMKDNKLSFLHYLAFVIFSSISILIFAKYPAFVIALPFTAGLSFIFLFIIVKEVPFFNNRLLIRIGQLSFSIYLFHFLFAWDFTQVLSRYLADILSVNAVFAICLPINILLTVGVAILSEKFIEKPGVHLGKFITTKYDGRVIRSIRQNARI